MTDLPLGFGIGGAIPTVAVAIGIVGGWIMIDGTGCSLTAVHVRDLGLVIVITMSIAVVEELVFRGYVLRNALEGLDLRWVSTTTTIVGAWSVLALLFAFAHPAPALVASLQFLGAGFLLGLAYLVSGQLGHSIGIHAGFNFVSGCVFPIASDPSVTIIAPLREWSSVARWPDWAGPDGTPTPSGARDTGIRLVANWQTGYQPGVIAQR